MPFKARRRCFFFDANGNPVDGGCTRTRYTCRFVHPDDDWWDELQPYVRKSGRSKSPGYNRPREREWDKPDRERDRGWHKTEEVWESDRTKTQRRDRERDDRDRDKEQRHDNEYLQRKERDKPRRISDVDRSRSRSNSQERHLDHNWGHKKDYVLHGGGPIKQEPYETQRKEKKTQRHRVKEEHMDSSTSLWSPMDTSEGDGETTSWRTALRSHNGAMTPTSPNTLRHPPTGPRALLSPTNNGANGHINGHMDVDYTSPRVPRIMTKHINGNGISKQNGHMYRDDNIMDVDSQSEDNNIPTSGRTRPTISIPPTPMSANSQSFSIPWKPAPPPPTAKPPIPPPPPLPTEPECFKDLEDDEGDSPVSSVEKAPDGKDEGPEERARKELWTERASLMADAILAYDNIVSLREELATGRQTLDLFQRSAFSNPSTISETTTQLGQLEASIEEAIKEADAALDQLVHNQFSWPIFEQEAGEVIEVENEEEDEEHYREMVEYVKELKKTAEEMRAAMLDIVEEIAKENEDEYSGEIRKVSDDEWGELRRVVPGQEQVIVQRPPSPPPSPPVPTPEEQEEILNQLVSYESVFKELRELLDQHDLELNDSLEGIVEVRVDDYLRSVHKKLERGREKEGEVGDMVDLTAQEAEEISGEINDMEEWLEKLDAEIEVEMKDREGWDVKLEELSHKISSLDMQHKETKETIQSLRSQLHMYLSAPPSPPPSPTPDRQSSKSEAQLNYILSECSESVKQMTRAAVMPLVESVRGELESLLMLNKRDVDYELKGRLDTTMRVMDVLHDRIVLGKEGMGHAVQMIQL